MDSNFQIIILNKYLYVWKKVLCKFCVFQWLISSTLFTLHHSMLHVHCFNRVASIFASQGWHFTVISFHKRETRIIEQHLWLTLWCYTCSIQSIYIYIDVQVPDSLHSMQGIHISSIYNCVINIPNYIKERYVDSLHAVYQ